jgi:HTH-type transcriptional regulator / antitoxin HigA
MAENKIIPFKASHPGMVLKDELKSRGIPQKEFAHDIDMQPSMLNEIVKGKRPVTAETALLFEKSLDIPASFWLQFQAQYELDQARIKVKLIRKTEQIETWKLIKQFVPVSILAKKGILSGTLNDNITRTWDIYEVKNIDEMVSCFSIHKNLNFYKKSDKLKSDPINIFAWSKVALWKARKEEVNTFKAQYKNSIIPELKEVFLSNRSVVAETKNIMYKYGIKFLIMEKFRQSPIDGYSFWSGRNPAIAMTLRIKTLDNFAFTIMHELGHVFEHLLTDNKMDFLDLDYPNSEQNEMEEEAHHFAKQCFMNENDWHTFLKQNPTFNYQTTEHNIIKFACTLGLHPSIVLGRYCFETRQFAVKTNIDRTIR